MIKEAQDNFFSVASALPDTITTEARRHGCFYDHVLLRNLRTKETPCLRASVVANTVRGRHTCRRSLVNVSILIK